MKILYLTHAESDYGGHYLWNGLCEVLGSNNIIDFPYKASYHGETDVYPSFYTPGEMGITAPHPWTIPRAGIKYSINDIKNKLMKKEFDMVICESPRSTVCNSLKELHKLLPKIIVLHDSEDYDNLREDIIDQYNVCLYLKREFIINPRRFLRNNSKCIMKPFPFSTYTNIPINNSDVPRDIDILCAIGDTHAGRKEIRSLVENLGADGWKVDINLYNWDEYTSKICRSKIVIAPRGWAYDTTRRWDATVGGAMVFAEKLNIFEETPMIDNVHCAIYSPDNSDFKTKMVHYLNNEPLRAKIALDGQKYNFNNNSNVARAKQLLNWVKNIKL